MCRVVTTMSSRKPNTRSLAGSAAEGSQRVGPKAGMRGYPTVLLPDAVGQVVAVGPNVCGALRVTIANAYKRTSPGDLVQSRGHALVA